MFAAFALLRWWGPTAAVKDLKNRPATRVAVRDAIVDRAPANALPGGKVALATMIHGVGTARAVRIFKTYGAGAIQVMSENPYRLARDIRGIGFKSADAIASKLGIEKTAMIRVRAGISYALTEAMDEGHCGLPTDELIRLAETLLEVTADLVRAALDLELGRSPKVIAPSGGMAALSEKIDYFACA